VTSAATESLKIFTSEDLSYDTGYTFSNNQIQSGQQVFVLGSDIYVGRSTAGVGGGTPELIQIDAADEQTDTRLKASVDGLVVSDKNILMLTYSNGRFEFIILDRADNTIVKKFSLLGRGVKLLCDDHYVYSIINDTNKVFDLFTAYEE
jgi:hypothetical protein